MENTMNTWSTAWKASKKPRKQRNYRTQAPLHIKQTFMHVHLSKELRKKLKMRHIGLHKDDKVKILVGNFKGKDGKVTALNLKKGKIFVEGIERVKKDGSKVRIPLEPSNVMITAIEKEEKRTRK
jgi:large subunit ribosomal protein L24